MNQRSPTLSIFLPGIYIGSHLANRVADHWLRPALAIMLMIVGSKLIGAWGWIGNFL